jgi:hypothetical protein
MTAASHNSSSLVKSLTWESFDCSSKKCWTQKGFFSTLVGNIASEPYTSENDVWPMARLGVVRKVHKTDGTVLSTSRHKALACQKFWVLNPGR